MDLIAEYITRVLASPEDGAVLAAPPERIILIFNEPVKPLRMQLIGRQVQRHSRVHSQRGAAFNLDGGDGLGVALVVELVASGGAFGVFSATMSAL